MESLTIFPFSNSVWSSIEREERKFVSVSVEGKNHRASMTIWACNFSAWVSSSSINSTTKYQFEGK